MFKPKTVSVKINRLSLNAILPTKAHPTGFSDAAFDLYPFIPGLLADDFDQPISVPDFSLDPGERKMIGTGIRVAIPEGYWIKFHERSGLANKGVHVLGGVIDSGYTGELKVILYNSNSNRYIHDCNKAITQFTVERVLPVELALISDEDMEVEVSKRTRKDSGFGSSDGK